MTIRVDDSLHISRQRETLLHEILHACWQYSYLWKMKRPDEEQVVSSLAFMLSAVLSANPWVGEFLCVDT